ncbi:hypothetical protein J6590_064035 [Homalodisca vitripennis]|nr:hypothetical protein J6590_064035 [Homalodisca vitripennis]
MPFLPHSPSALSFETTGVISSEAVHLSFSCIEAQMGRRMDEPGCRRSIVPVRTRTDQRVVLQCVSTSVSDPQLVEVVGWNEDVYLNKVFFHSKDIADTVIFVLSAPPSVQVNEVLL